MIERREAERRQIDWHGKYGQPRPLDRRHADRRSDAMAMDELIASTPCVCGCGTGLRHIEPDLSRGGGPRKVQIVPGADDPMWLAAQGDWDAFVKQVTR